MVKRAKHSKPVPTEWINEIPVAASPFKARVVSVSAAMLALLGALAWMLCPQALDAFLSRNGEIHMLYGGSLMLPALQLVFLYFAVVGGICGLAGLASLLRNRATYRFLRASLAVVYPLVLVYIYIAWEILFGVLAAELDIDGNKQDRATILLSWWSVAGPALAAALYVAWLHIMLYSRSVVAAFTAQAGAPLHGDQVLEDLRTHGHEPRHRRSLYSSFVTHLTILVFIPLLMEMGGCVTAYRVPKGTGEAAVVTMVKMVKPKKKKKKTLSLRPNSAIIFEVPDLDNTEVDEMIEEQSQVTYVANANAKSGKIGKGGPGKGGWPEGMEKYKIRFIRLEHGGAGWDDGMDAKTGADVNFLRAFAKATGFTKIASKGESHSIRLLKKYPKDGFPPFVYMTGNDHMGRVSGNDVKILRDYCLKGGMLIADAGSRRFHDSFVHFMRQVFPDKPLLDIADDDMLYQLPYGFPNGAPAFWHHGGRRALGIKHEGRWCVFYHPGDMNDAWKSQGYTDVTPEMRQAAMNLGVNIVYYAFNQWDDAVAKQRK
ncbi:MAG: DUF4159 domain-containing protein [Verrucomicrobia bacterium]|jgi:hypothetical protein|nr:DUF4159 domain-containing protein [Verrucomicrobiota bacterium]MBT7068592.1 DUF4159 domain-containing protein [Verrucomicrobiota bacterium]MBT7698744.1 DUF4159 domain-containing protein [Verrucomicrobiota bacterium]